MPRASPRKLHAAGVCRRGFFGDMGPNWLECVTALRQAHFLTSEGGGMAASRFGQLHQEQRRAMGM